MDGIRVRLERVICFCDPTYCIYSQCNIKFKSASIASMTLIGTLIKPITTIRYTAQTFYQFSNNEYRPILINVAVDYCGNESGFLQSAMHAFVKAAWGNTTNLFSSCPLQPGEYYIKDWNFDASHLPNVVPAGRYSMKTVVYDSDQFVLNNSVYFQVSNYGVSAFNMG